jgi:DnaD/phage-associated family protein
VTGRESLAEAVGISVQNVRTVLKRLVDSDVIEIDTTNKFTVIKIKNFEKYQENQKNQPANNQVETQTREAVEGVGDLEVNHQLTINQPTTNQQVTTPKELKKERNKEYNNIDGGAYNIYNNYNIGDAPPPPEKSEVPSSEVGEVFSLYEQNIGVLSPIIVDILKDRITAQGAALVSLAVVEAVKNGAKSIKYIEKVLNAWEDDNITTVESAKLRIAERQANSQKRSDGTLPGNVANSKFRNYPEDANAIGEIEMQKIKEMMNL